MEPSSLLLLGVKFREVPLTKGAVAIVDVEDYEKVSSFNWCLNDKGYAHRRLPLGPYNQTTRYLHQEILGIYGEVDIDHKDGDPLNNRRDNLRPCTASQNGANARKRISPRNTSCYKGVSLDHKKWRARIRKEGRLFHLGCFDSEVGAARAYDVAAVKMFGEFARLNFGGV